MSETQLLDLIERGNDAHPVCDCGRYTMPIAHDDALWIECSSLAPEPSGTLGRALRSVTRHLHTSLRLLDMPDTTSAQDGALPTAA